MDITPHPSSDVIHVCNPSQESRIVAFMFTKRQLDGWRGYWDFSTSGNGWIETHFNIQRRLYDYQLALASRPSDLEQRHQAFIHLYNTTAHQGLLVDKRLPPIPVEVLGTAQGRPYTPEVLAEKFA